MKYLLLFIALLSLSLCDAPPKNKIIAIEDAFLTIKKNILECIKIDTNASAELKKYAADTLATDLKESLNLHKYRENATDKEVIRKCRREAFIKGTEKRPLTPVTPINNQRFLAK